MGDAFWCICVDQIGLMVKLFPPPQNCVLGIVEKFCGPLDVQLGVWPSVSTNSSTYSIAKYRYTNLLGALLTPSSSLLNHLQIFVCLKRLKSKGQWFMLKCLYDECPFKSEAMTSEEYWGFLHNRFSFYFIVQLLSKILFLADKIRFYLWRAYNFVS